MRHRPVLDDLLVVAGIGWKDGVVGAATVPTGPASPPGRALATCRPVLIPDLRAQSEFEPSPLLAEHGVVSVLNVPIRTDGTVWGVLEVDGSEPRAFGEEALLFLQGFANLLGAAVRRIESETNLRAVADLVPDMLWFTDPAAGIDWHNRRWAEYTGQSPHQAAGEGWLQAVHPEDRARSRARLIEALRADGRLEHEHRIRSAEGRYRWFLVRAEPVRDASGAFRRLFGAATDIHDRKLAQEALSRSEERLRRAFEIDTVGVIFFDPGGRITEANDAFLGLCGFTREDLAAGLLHRDALTPPGHMETFRRATEELRRAGRTAPHETEYLRKDGTRWWGLSTARLLAGDEGVEFILDITEMKRVAEELRAARDAAEEAVRAKSRFLATVSHDLRQPVMAANLFLTLLQKRDLGPGGSDLAHSLTDALDGLNRMLNSLLEIARLDAGIVAADMREFPLDELLRRLDGEFRGLARQAGLRLAMAAAPWTIRSDAVLVEMILRNLISNAIKYTESGEVAVAARAEGESVVIEVADTGIGIAEADLGRIFEDYYQSGETTRDHSRGFGIGLATVRRVAGLLGTEVRVQSAVGRGSTFSFTLPRGHGAPAAGTAGASGGGELAGRCALVVDDEPLILKGLELMLDDLGIEVHAARTLRQVDEVLKRLARAPDLVLADYTLARGERGTEAIERARRLGPTQAVLITGDTSPDRLSEAERSGSRLLHKPIDPEALEALLKELLAPRDQTPARPLE